MIWVKMIKINCFYSREVSIMVKSKKTKRLLCMTLAILLVFTMGRGIAFAEGGTSGETPTYHVNSAQVQGINGTTLQTGPNYKHVPKTYTFDLNKGDYPVPYGGNGIPLANGLAGYIESCGIFFPGDKLTIIPEVDPNPNGHGDHGRPGVHFSIPGEGWHDFQTGEKIGPLLVTKTVTHGDGTADRPRHTYVQEVEVVDAPVMFKYGWGGTSSYASSGTNPDNNTTWDWWGGVSMDYIELPAYHPIEYHYLCNGQEIPAEDLAGMEFYENQPANPEVIWAEDLSVAFLPYVTWSYNDWMNNKTGAEFTFSRPYIEGYAFDSMRIGQNGDNFWAWEPTKCGDEQSYTSRFRLSGDMDYNWRFENRKEGSEEDPIVVTINYKRNSSSPSTVAVEANGGTINGRPEWIFNYTGYYNDTGDYRFKPAEHIPVREGYVFDGWYQDAACTQVISPSLENGKDLNGRYNMDESMMQSYVTSYANRLFEETEAPSFRIYAKWAPAGSKLIADLDISGIETKTYTGSEITQNPVIKDGTKTLALGTDYRILGYENNVNVSGNAKVIIQGIGDYRGITTKTFSIARKPVTIDFDLEYDMAEFDGTWHYPQIKNFTCSEPGLEYNSTNFYTGYSNSRDASTETRKAEAYIYAKGNYTSDTVRKNFTITPRTFTPTIELSYTKTTYTGERKAPYVTVKDGDTVISSSSVNYSTQYTNNVEVGTATVTVTMKGNYAGTNSATFEIVAPQKTLSVAIDESDYTAEERIYDDWEKRPKVIAKSGEKVLTEGTDYILEYANNLNAGKGTVTVVGTGAYAGSKGTANFTIEPFDLSTSGFSLDGKVPERRYTGQPVEPKPYFSDYINGIGYTQLREGYEYTASYADNVQAGTATFIMTGKGNYKGSLSTTFNIVKRDTAIVDLSTAAIVSDVGPFTYNGSEWCPTPYVTVDGKTLKRGNDYELSWKDNVEIGTATMTVKGVDDYKGTITKTFEILDPDADRISLSGAEVTGIANKTFTGSAITQSPTVKVNGAALVYGTDYTISYQNNINAGTATMTVSGIGQYAGRLSRTFSILPKKVAIPAGKTFTYTGKVQTGVAAGAGYTVNGNTASNAGAYTAKLVLKDKANSTWGDGTTADKTAAWKINAKAITPVVTLKATSYTWTGKEIKPAVTVKDGTAALAAANYTVSYAENKNAGTASVIVKMKGNYSGSKTVKFTIRPKKIVPAVTLSATAYTYTGKVFKPAVTVKNGTAKLAATTYTVTYKANKNVGKASVIVKMKGNYSGSKMVSFKINPKGTVIKSLTRAKKAATVKWTKQATKMSASVITGYEIQLATNASFTQNKNLVAVAGYGKVSKKVTGLEARKKYYVRIRTYKSVGGVKYYSPWSKSKTVTTK